MRPVAVATCDLDSLIVSGLSPFQAPFPLGHECVAEVDRGRRLGRLARRRASSSASPSRSPVARCDGVSRRTHLQLRRGAVHVHLRVRSGGGPVGWLPRPTWSRSPSPSTCSFRCRRGSSPPRWRAPRTTSATRGGRWGPRWPNIPGADVLVVGGAGPGSIGLYAAGLAVALGSGSVLYVDGDVARREIASRLGAQTLAEKPKRVGPYPITVDASADPGRPEAGAALDLGGRGVHQHGDLLRRAAASAAAGDVHEGDHLPHRTRQRPQRDAPRARPGRRGPPASRARHEPRGPVG